MENSAKCLVQNREFCVVVMSNNYCDKGMDSYMYSVLEIHRKEQLIMSSGGDEGKGLSLLIFFLFGLMCVWDGVYLMAEVSL